MRSAGVAGPGCLCSSPAGALLTEHYTARVAAFCFDEAFLKPLRFTSVGNVNAAAADGSGVVHCLALLLSSLALSTPNKLQTPHKLELPTVQHLIMFCQK